MGDNTRVEINGDKILYGEREGEYLDGFTVATYADGALSTIYEFKSGLVTSWQQFFSPDGQQAGGWPGFPAPIPLTGTSP